MYSNWVRRTVCLRWACVKRFERCGIVGCQHMNLWRTALLNVPCPRSSRCAKVLQAHRNGTLTGGSVNFVENQQAPRTQPSSNALSLGRSPEVTAGMGLGDFESLSVGVYRTERFSNLRAQCGQFRCVETRPPRTTLFGNAILTCRPEGQVSVGSGPRSAAAD